MFDPTHVRSLEESKSESQTVGGAGRGAGVEWGQGFSWENETVPEMNSDVGHTM